MIYDIEINDLVKTYKEVTAVDHLHLQVRRGEMLGLIGPDGAGKTSTLRILCGLLRADSGDCRVAGFSVAKQLHQIRSLVGYMPQRFSLYPDLTVAENLRFFADLFGVSRQEREERLERLLQFSKLEPFSKRRAQALSGGMKQKLALSCTLIHTPQVLLLDEPTTGVDPVSRREFWEILKDLRDQGVTILVSTPYMDEAARCDRVAFIHKGKILALDTPEKIPDLFSGILYEITCDDFVRAANLLKEERGIASVQIFGDRVHVSGSDDGKIRAAIDNAMSRSGVASFEKNKIRASIEDVFVDLMR